ncbi:MAG: helix-turn-helix domain-containing protein [Bacteroidota bacterium]
MGIECESIELGLVRTREELSGEQMDQFREKLASVGMDLLTDKKKILVEKIKNLIIERVHNLDEIPDTKDSEFLQEKLGYNYTYLSNLFSEVNGMTIKHYIILNKIERTKELLLFEDLTLTEIADKLQYSSVGHLSNQFKEVTGYSPSHFREKKNLKLKFIEDL